MELKPVSGKTPGYPVESRKSKLVMSLASFVRGGVKLTAAVILVLIGSEFASLAAGTDANPGIRPSTKTNESDELRPCRGKIAEPPCRGVIAPPPCRGSVPPPIDVTPPRITYQSVSLGEFYRNARYFLGRRVRIHGILGRMPSGTLVDLGYYLYQKGETNSFGEMYGCPLIGDPGGFREGRPVIVEGTVVRVPKRSGLDRRSGNYFALSIERIGYE